MKIYWRKLLQYANKARRLRINFVRNFGSGIRADWKLLEGLIIFLGKIPPHPNPIHT